VADVIGEYLVAQIEAGVDAVQIFDSWVGALNAADYREFILPHNKKIFDRVRARNADAGGDGVPTIHFGVGTGSILADLREAGGDVIGADWRNAARRGWEAHRCRSRHPGYLDPTLLLAARSRVRRHRRSAGARAGRPGHIFNLGHGILPTTPVEHVQALARYVHQKTRV